MSTEAPSDAPVPKTDAENQPTQPEGGEISDKSEIRRAETMANIRAVATTIADRKRELDRLDSVTNTDGNGRVVHLAEDGSAYATPPDISGTCLRDIDVNALDPDLAIELVQCQLMLTF